MPPMAPRPAAAVGRGPRLELSVVVEVAVVAASSPSSLSVPVGAAVVDADSPEVWLLVAAPLVAEGLAQVTAVGTFTPAPLQI